MLYDSIKHIVIESRLINSLKNMTACWCNELKKKKKKINNLIDYADKESELLFWISCQSDLLILEIHTQAYSGFLQYTD